VTTRQYYAAGRKRNAGRLYDRLQKKHEKNGT